MRIALLASTAAMIVVSVAGAAHAAAGPSCSVASPKKVKAALGVTVASASVTRNGPVTVCQFMTPAGLLVRFQTSETASMYAFGRKSFTTHGAPTKTVAGIGKKAYSSSFKGSNTIVVLQNTTELLVTSSMSLAKLEALARLILPSL